MCNENIIPTKICTKCGEKKFIRGFYKRSSRCKQCTLSMQKEFRHKNRERYNIRARTYHHGNKDRQRNGKLKRLYGLTLEQKQKLYIFQNGCCGICYSPVEFNKICVDHDHATKKIRGLLCHKCNLATGLFNNSPGILATAKIYLQKA